MTAAESLNKSTNEFNFESKVEQARLDLSPLSVETLQLNLTKMCNQQCFHCHVDSSPRRKEAMDDEGIAQILKILQENDRIAALDITGGAPELHPKFKYLVEAARGLDKKVMVRHNLTVQSDPHPATKEDLSYLPQFFHDQRVEVWSSLPYYQEFFTDKQRGEGVFKKSITGLKNLNKFGYGVEGSGLSLNLIYNPVGAYLPPDQANLELEYKKHLDQEFGIKFNHLFGIANMPIHRFKFQLKRQDNLNEYMEKLIGAFNPEAAKGIMCRSMISVSYDGYLFDCDFNQMLDMKVGAEKPLTIYDFDYDQLMKRKILFADHCFGCTAGAGSSCGGATA